MATPNWDILHLRFASGARDEVSSAASNGTDLTVADRDFFLNQAYLKYVNAVLKVYADDKHRLRTLMFDLVKHYTGAAVAGEIDLSSTPTDFGVAVAVSFTDKPVFYISPHEYIELSNSINPEVGADSDLNLLWTQQDTSILLLPSTLAGDFGIAYIQKALDITRNGSTDISLSNRHWDAIIESALYIFYRAKMEFQEAEAHKQEMYNAAPFLLTLQAEGDVED